MPRRFVEHAGFCVPDNPLQTFLSDGFTTQEALERFSAACTAASASGAAAPAAMTAKQVDREHERAMADLRKMGV